MSEVAETCLLAIDTINFKLAKTEKIKNNQSKNQSHDEEKSKLYHSVDPAPPAEDVDSSGKGISIEELRDTMNNLKLPLFNRYRAMFKLRDIGTKDAVDALGSGFVDPSPLVRHEIAYVMGQIMSQHAVPYLKKALEDKKEHGMVRHEAAEALGAIGTQEATDFVSKFLNDEFDIVKESCYVALDIAEEQRPEHADGIVT